MQKSKRAVNTVSKTNIDLVIADEGFVATVAFKRRGQITQADWWVSGMNYLGDVVLLLRLELPVVHSVASEPMDFCTSFFQSEIRSLALFARAQGGLVEPSPSTSVDYRRELALTHLRQHDNLETSDALLGTMGERTAYQFKLIKSFGYSAATPLIAEHEQVPTSTVSRRLWLAREAGNLPKVSTSNDREGA